MTRVIYFIRYVLIFLKALTLANYEVAKLVLLPRPRFRPGFVAVPMDAQSDLEITSLANSITLTPGTISVHISDDRDTIVVHALNVGDDIDSVRRDVKRTLEANILKWTRGPTRGPSRGPTRGPDRGRDRGPSRGPGGPS